VQTQTIVFFLGSKIKFCSADSSSAYQQS